MDNLEGRFILEEKPILYVICNTDKTVQNIDAASYEIHIINIHHITITQVLEKLLLSPVDAVFTDVNDQELLNGLYTLGFVFYSTSMLIGHKGEKIHKFGKQVFTYGGATYSGFYVAAKRVFDIVISIPGIIMTFLIFIIFAPLIRLESPGPIIYKQERVGYNGRKFYIYKFRTMYEGADLIKDKLMSKNEMDAQLFKIKNDPRITKVGRFMRIRSLDEFPQFLNVLQGDMSVVGTRPPSVDELKRYKLHHKRRLLCKPGITGIWQVNGRNKITKFEEIIKMDMKYIRNCGIMLDFQLVLKTIYCIMKKDGR